MRCDHSVHALVFPDLNEETKAKRGDNKPLHELNEDECVKFNTGYKLERSGDVYLCSWV